MINPKSRRFTVTSMTITQEAPSVEFVTSWDAFTTPMPIIRGPVVTSMDISLVFHNEKAVADLGRIPEFTEMLHDEMNRLGLCRFCGCQLPDDDKPNCSQCGGPRVDRT